MIPGKKSLFLPAVLALVLLFTTAPYVLAWSGSGPDHVFGGFLFNPLDGNSYLAKMRQGYGGQWQFRLPFTAEPGEGAYLFLFYLALGHLARILDWPLLLVFHLARIAGSAVLTLALYRFFERHLPATRSRRFAFLLAVFGSGMGWLTVPFGGFTSDFWVAEAYPFLSTFANPHFPLSLALLLGILTPPESHSPSPIFQRAIVALAAGAGLALISPFGLALGLGLLALLTLLAFLRGQGRTWPFPRLVWFSLGGGPVVVYDVWVVSRHPALSVWNAQNLTPTPGPGDLLLSFSPALIVALIAFPLWIRGVRDPRSSAPELFCLWILLVAALIWLPVNLQRRLLMGFYVPLAGLAAWVLERVLAARPARARFLKWMVLLLALPTNLLVLGAALHGASTHDPALYLTRAEARALEWIVENTPPDALLAAAPETGLFIPAWTGRRVTYGHPFETVDAEREREAVRNLFREAGNGRLVEAFITSRGVDYLFWGPREQALASADLNAGAAAVFQAGDVTLFSIPP